MPHLFSTRAAALVLVSLLTAVGGCSKKEQAATVAPAQAQQEVRDSPGVLSTFAAEELAVPGGSDQKHAQQNKSDKPNSTNNRTDYFNVEFNRQGKGVAYIAKVGDKTRVVHNGRPGKLYGDIDSYTFALSLDGQHVGYAASNESSQGKGAGGSSGMKWMLVHDGIEEGPYDGLGPAVFSPDNLHVVFECKTGERWKMCVDNKSYGDAFSYIDKPLFSSDSKLFLFGETGETGRNPRIVVSDLEFKKQRIFDQSGGPVAINTQHTRVAITKESNKFNRIVEFDFSLTGKVIEGQPYDEIRSPVFSADGTALVYLAKRGADTFLVLEGKEERLPVGEYPWPPVVKPDNKGAGIAIVGSDGAYLYQAFGGGGPTPNRYREIADVVYSNDGRNHAYVAIKDDRFLIVANGKEGPVYDRVISPQFSPDGKYLVYRARKANKRFVVIADATGRVIKEHPGYERVFEATFTKDGSSVAYGVIDGKQIMWKVEKL